MIHNSRKYVMKPGKLFLFLAMTAALAAGQSAQTPVTIRSKGIDSWPLRDIADELMSKMGWLIDYEDPLYTFQGDLVDVTIPQFRAIHPEGHLWAARHASLSFQIDPSKPLDAMTTIQSAVALNAAVGNPGKFSVLQKGRHFIIVPAAANNSAGVLQAQKPLFDYPITFPAGVRSGMEVLSLIGNQLKSASGSDVGLGSVPINYLIQTQVSFGANDEPARDVLLKLVNQLRWRDSRITIPMRQFVWHVLYSPGDLKTAQFVINIDLAMKQVRSPNGAMIEVPIR